MSTTIQVPTLDKAKEMMNDTKNEYYSWYDRLNAYKFGTAPEKYTSDTKIEELFTKAKYELATESEIKTIIDNMSSEITDPNLYDWTNTRSVPFIKVPLSPYIIKMVYGNGKFVCLSNASKTYWSVDGLNWNESSLNSQLWRSIYYGGGKFIAVATDSGSIAYSDNGENWSYSPAMLVMNWKDVCYGNGKFVAVTEYISYTAYSTDGINWTTNKLGYKWTFKEVCFGNGIFVGISESTPYIIYSSDGITWTAVENAPSNLEHIYFGSYLSSGKVCSSFIITSDGLNKILKSEDGKTWASNNFTINNSSRGIYNAFGCFFVLNGYRIYYFRQGSPSSLYYFGLERNHNYNTICYGNGKLILAGGEGNILVYYLISDYEKTLINLLYHVNSTCISYSGDLPSKYPCTFWTKTSDTSPYTWQRIE